MDKSLINFQPKQQRSLKQKNKNKEWAQQHVLTLWAKKKEKS